jgi:hypothetical protein
MKLKKLAEINTPDNPHWLRDCRQVSSRRSYVVLSRPRDRNCCLLYYRHIQSRVCAGSEFAIPDCEVFKVKIKLSLCLTNKTLRHKGVWGIGCINPHFLYLGTNSRSMISFTPRQLCPRGKIPRQPLDRLAGSQSRSGRYGEQKILDPTRTRNSEP